MSSVINAVKSIKEKFIELNKSLENPNLLSDIKKMTETNRELKRLTPVIAKYDAYLLAEETLRDALQIIETEKDSDMVTMLKSEIENNKKLLVSLEDEIKILLLPKDENDDRNVIIEIRGAAGGDEANIFAGDLYRMYTRYADQKRWKIDIIDMVYESTGGYSYVSFIVKGDSAYSKLKFENGVHRVQRVPATETQGRVHTSTASVVAMPEMDDVDVTINPADLKIDTLRAGGAGGQHVNKTESAIRITHMPSGLVVACQESKSQHENRAKAMMMLRARLYEKTQNEQLAKIGDIRKNAVGTGDRSEKIRTYNYPQNRVTDHRIKLTLNKLDQVMEGNLEEIISSLVVDEQNRLLSEQK